MYNFETEKKNYNPPAYFNYKEVDLIRKYITEQGKILPRRVTGLSSKQHKRLTKAIKRARILALLPFIYREW